MPEVIDDEEIKQEQKEANESRREPVEGPVDNAELAGAPVDNELPGASAPAELPDQVFRPAEIDDDDDADDLTAKRPLYKRPAVIVLASIVLLIGAIIGLRYWLYARSHESTDDAFIDGHIIQISPKASGYVAKAYVDDNQHGKEGNPLVLTDSKCVSD